MAHATHAGGSANAGAASRHRANEGPAMPVLIDIGEVASHLGVTVRHVRRLVAERRIPYVKWGNLLRFDSAEIGAWIRQRCVEPRGARPPLVRRQER
jgi:excisionase family DNA binding protein